MIIIHLGLHKTGTTFLQNEIFPKIDFHFIKYFNFTKNNILEKTIISDERLSGSPHLLIDSNIRYELLDRLKLLFPDAKIILGVRDIESWITSLYTQHLVCGGTLTFKLFEEYIRKSDYINTKLYIDKIRKLFDEVLIYKQEDLLSNSDKIIRDICDFIGCSVPMYNDVIYRKSFNRNQLYIIRNLNKILPTKIANVLWREVQLRIRKC